MFRQQLGNDIHPYLYSFNNFVFYDTETNSRASNVAFVAPSVTTFTGLNPAYRIYTVDAGHEDASYVNIYF